MRKIIYLLAFVFSFSAFGQVENFKIENKQVYWQKVYDSSKSIEDIKKAVSNLNGFKITEETPTSISGEFKNVIMNYRDAGYSYMATPLVLNETNKFYGLFKIELKDNRYRATVKNLQSEGATMSTYGMVGFSSDLDTTLEFMALDKNKTEFRKSFAKAPSKIIHTTFLQLFDLSKVGTKTDNNW